MTDRYAVLGNPVAHSQSPFIHGEFARQTGQDLHYDRLLCPIDGFEAQLQAFADGGGRGCNVTVPFKFEAFQAATSRTGRAELALAANTLRRDGASWSADNTDGVGLRRDIEVNAGVSLQGARVLLIGAGGAAAGVLGPLIEARPAMLVVVNRTADKAASLVQRHAAWALSHGVELAARPLQQPGQAFDLVINASSSSLQGEASPVGEQVLKPSTLAVDLMYGPAAAGFLDWASSRGARPRDGLGMLVEQAAFAFHFWRGVHPDTAPVLQALRERIACKA